MVTRLLGQLMSSNQLRGFLHSLKSLDELQRCWGKCDNEQSVLVTCNGDFYVNNFNTCMDTWLMKTIFGNCYWNSSCIFHGKDHRCCDKPDVSCSQQAAGWQRKSCCCPRESSSFECHQPVSWRASTVIWCLW